MRVDSSSGVDLFVSLIGEIAQQSYSTTIVGGGPVLIASRVHRGMTPAMSVCLALIPGLETQTAAPCVGFV